MEGPRDPRETETELCLSVSCGLRVSSGLPGGRGSGCSTLGYGITLLEEVTINHTIEPPEVTQDWEIDSWRAQQNLVHQDPGERSSDPTGDCPGLACGCPGVSGGGVGWWWPAAGLGALTVSVHASFEGGHHYLHYLHHSLAPGK